MKKKKIEPAQTIRGALSLPGDKSISHRAIMLGAIACGTTSVSNSLVCEDCGATTRAFLQMGVPITKSSDGRTLTIEGRGLRGLRRPKDGTLYLGESGTTMRLLAGILAGQRFGVSLTGGPSLSGRPMLRIIEPLGRMGVFITAEKGNVPPITINGGLSKPIEYKTKIASAQVKSSILFAGLYLDGVTSVVEPARSRDHTERMLGCFGADITARGLKVSVRGKKELHGAAVTVPGDLSSAAFFLVAASLLPGARLSIPSVGLNPTRSGIINVLRRMGANLSIKEETCRCEPAGTITAVSSKTRGTVVEADELPQLIDEIPALMVLAALSDGRTVIRGARELRVKETDRIVSMRRNLTKMGAKIQVQGDDIIIDGVASLHGAKLEGFNDHRTAMSMAIAALTAEGPSELDDTACVAKSFPEFFNVLARVTKY